MKKNILIVDDSALMRRVLSDTVSSDPRFTVKDVAINGEEALQLLLAAPDLYDAALVDIYMPKMTGLELLENLEKHREVKTPVIICSTKADESAEETMMALEHGAFDFIKKPENLIHASSNTFKDTLIAVLEVATETKSEAKKVSIPTPVKPASVTIPVRKEFMPQKGTGNKIIALACSTGGPKTLQSVIPLLPKELNAPMVLVQHMPVGFTKSLAMRLNDMSKVQVKEAVNGEPLQKGTVYIAPGGKHLKVNCVGGIPKAEISDDPPRDALRPCANIMYESLMNSKYDEVVCVVLTGMGADGTAGIKALKQKKRLYVIAQDEATSVVYGMPKMVAREGLTDEILPVTEIADIITKKVGVQ